jgi:hypothetical protein
MAFDIAPDLWRDNPDSLKAITALAAKYGFEPAPGIVDPPHFQAEQLITRGTDGYGDDQFRALIAVAQAQAKTSLPHTRAQMMTVSKPVFGSQQKTTDAENKLWSVHF